MTNVDVSQLAAVRPTQRNVLTLCIVPALPCRHSCGLPMPAVMHTIVHKRMSFGFQPPEFSETSSASAVCLVTDVFACL